MDDQPYGEDDWIYNDVLRALDEEVDPPIPMWIMEWTAEFLEGWDALEHGPDLWMLERWEWGQDALIHRLKSRTERLERLVALQAPKIILLNETRMVAEARAMFWWQHRKRVLRQIAALHDDAS